MSFVKGGPWSHQKANENYSLMTKGRNEVEFTLIPLPFLDALYGLSIMVITMYISSE